MIDMLLHSSFAIEPSQSPMKQDSGSEHMDLDPVAAVHYLATSWDVNLQR